MPPCYSSRLQLLSHRVGQMPNENTNKGGGTYEQLYSKTELEVSIIQHPRIYVWSNANAFPLPALSKWWKSDKSAGGHHRAVAELTIFVRTCGPNTTILFDHHAVVSASNNGHYTSRDHL